MESQKILITKAKLKKKNKFEGITLADVNLY